MQTYVDVSQIATLKCIVDTRGENYIEVQEFLHSIGYLWKSQDEPRIIKRVGSIYMLYDYQYKDKLKHRGYIMHNHELPEFSEYSQVLTFGEFKLKKLFDLI